MSLSIHIREFAGADVAQIIGIISMAMAIEGDAELPMMLRQSAGCPADQPLILQLPTVPAALEIDPGGVLRPLRTSKATHAPSLEALVAAHSELDRRVRAAYVKAEPAAQAL
ncbi:MAG: hypothetical protein JWO83_1562, partial [Caulobacteraceae bacterium]|nr:hypothetical protein [Caulobacteraceae bacterium]